MEIVRAHTYFHFSCTVVNNMLLRHVSDGNREEFHLTGYSVAGRMCELKVREYLRDKYRNSKIAAELVFEDRDKAKGKLQTRLNSDPNCLQPIFKPNTDRLDRNGDFKAGFVPLQAADWFSYELAIAARPLETTDSIKPLSKQRWPLQQLLRMLGADGVVSYDDAVKFDRNVELYKNLRIWWRKSGL